MKTILALVFALSAFAASAVELPLGKLANASHYDLKSLETEYDALYGTLIMSVWVKPEFEVRGHPELNVDTVIADKASMELIGNEFVAKIDAKTQVVCAKIVAAKTLESGLCQVKTKVVGNDLLLVLSIK